jgi:hypothetical protein
MPFVITCTAWKALFQEKENKNKEEELAKPERKRKEKRTSKTQQVNPVFKKLMIKGVSF